MFTVGFDFSVQLAFGGVRTSDVAVTIGYSEETANGRTILLTDKTCLKNELAADNVLDFKDLPGLINSLVSQSSCQNLLVSCRFVAD